MKCWTGWSTNRIKTTGRNINNLRYADDTTLMAESEEELKSLLIKVKEESEKAGLKLNIQKTKIMASGPFIAWKIERKMGKCGNSDRFPLPGLQNHCRWCLQLWNQKTASWQENNNKLKQCVEKQRHYSANKGLYSQGYSLPSSHIWLWQLDLKEGRMPKNWCLWTVVLEKTPESPLESKEIKPFRLKGDQPWIFTGRTDAEADHLMSTNLSRDWSCTDHVTDHAPMTWL